MIAARPNQKKKRDFKLTRTSVLALVGVFLIFVGIGTFGINVSRSNQLAAALVPPSCGTANPQCPREDATNTYNCQYPGNDPRDSKKRCAKGKMCSEGKVQGTCQCPTTCKGNANEATDKSPKDEKPKEEPKKEDGKPPEMPKLPEPPKKEPPPPGTPPSDACKDSTFGGVDANGQPCPGSTNLQDCLLNPTSLGCPGAENPTTTPATTTATSTLRSWFAIVRTVADGVADVAAGTADVVSNVVQSIGTTFGGNSVDVVNYEDSGKTQDPNSVSTGDDTNSKTFAQTTGFNTTNNTGSSMDLGGTQSSGGFFNWAATQLQNFLNRF